MTTAKEIMQFILCLVILAAITWPLWGLGKMAGERCADFCIEETAP